MTKAAVEIYRRQTPTQVTPQEWDTFRQIAATVARSRLGLEAWYIGQNPTDNIMVGLLFAQAIDVPPLMVLQNAYPVKGRVTMMTEFLLGLCRDRIPGFDLRVVEQRKESCTVEVSRAGMKEPLTYTHTTQMARDNGYFKDAWLKQEQMMNYYAAARRAIRMVGGAGSMWLAAVPKDAMLGEEPAAIEESSAEVVEESEDVAEAASRAAEEAVEDESSGGPSETATPPSSIADVEKATKEARAAFMAVAKEAGINTRSHAAMQSLVAKLLSDHGAPVSPRSSAEVARSEWDLARKRLEAVVAGTAPGGAFWGDLSNYGVGGAPKGPAQGTDPRPPAEEGEGGAAAGGVDGATSNEASEVASGPPVSAPKPAQGSDYEHETDGTEEGLIHACRRAEKYYKAIGQGDVAFLTEWKGPDDPAPVLWFVFHPILEANGRISPTGAGRPVRLSELDERARFQYATQVRGAIQELEAKGVLRGAVR